MSDRSDPTLNILLKKILHDVERIEHSGQESLREVSKVSTKLDNVEATLENLGKKVDEHGKELNKQDKQMLYMRRDVIDIQKELGVHSKTPPPPPESLALVEAENKQKVLKIIKIALGVVGVIASALYLTIQHILG